MGTVNTKFAYTAGVSALAGIFIFVFFGPNVKGNKKERKFQVRGLPNMGSTCYVSAVLQSLAACTHFRNWLLFCYQRYNPLDEKGQPIINSKSHLFPLVASLHMACLHVNRQDLHKSDTFNPQISILKILSSMNYQLARRREQDACELFEHIMSALHEETTKMTDHAAINDYASVIPTSSKSNDSVSQINTNTNSVLSQVTYGVDPGAGDTQIEQDVVHRNDAENSLSSKQRASLNSYLQNNGISKQIIPHISHRLGYYHSAKKSFPMNPFFGTLASKLKCLTCFTERRWVLEKYHAFSLPLPPRSSEVLTILDLINNYFKTVIVHEVECSVCTANNGTQTKSSFSKCTVVAKFPLSICFQIQRTTWSSAGGCTKRSDFVTFHETLDLSRVPRLADIIMKAKCKTTLNGNNGDSAHSAATANASSLIHNSLLRSHGCKYRLCAVISHSGVADSGHFVTFRRGPLNNDKWFLTSDEDIYDVPLVSVLSSNAYMLFYEFVESDSSKEIVY